jgi:hypothetical protein
MTGRQAGIGKSAHRTGAWRKSVAASLLCAASLMALPTGAATPAPIKIAIFDFELEDFSAAGSSTAETPADAAQLASLTTGIRELLAQSGRYSPVDVANADAPPAKAHTLRQCKGCEAAIALNLGAEQSFVGLVTRISRMEYTVTFQIRDARTGAVVTHADSGLRMGADYSWNRGATRLVKDRLLLGQPQQ